MEGIHCWMITKKKSNQKKKKKTESSKQKQTERGKAVETNQEENRSKKGMKKKVKTAQLTQSRLRKDKTLIMVELQVKSNILPPGYVHIVNIASKEKISDCECTL